MAFEREEPKEAFAYFIPGGAIAMIKIPALDAGDTLIYTLRHGLTELNRDKRIGGQSLDVPLLPEGVNQAEEARARFAGTPVDIVIRSTHQCRLKIRLASATLICPFRTI